MECDAFTSTLSPLLSSFGRTANMASFSGKCHASRSRARRNEPLVNKLRLRPAADEHVDAAFGDKHAERAVQVAGVSAELRHIAENSDTAPGECGEGRNRGGHRIRVGVIAVVDQRQVPCVIYTGPAADRGVIEETQPDLLARQAELKADCRGGQRAERHMAPKRRDKDGQAPV